MHCEAHIGKGVFDFGAIVKAETADEFIAKAAAAENLFKGAGLEVGAVFDGAGLAGIVVENLLKFACNEFGFGLSVAGFEIAEISSAGRSLADAVQALLRSNVDALALEDQRATERFQLVAGQLLVLPAWLQDEC